MAAIDEYGTVVVEASGDRPRHDIDNGDDDSYDDDGDVVNNNCNINKAMQRYPQWVLSHFG